MLIGPMGCGKTTVGRLIADRLGRPFLDNDEHLTLAAGLSAARIADDAGLDELHRHEAASFAEMLAANEPSVIAAAASVTDGDLGHSLGQHVVVALRCDPPVVAVRRARSTHRPTIPHDEARWHRRDEAAAAVAHIVVDTSSASAEDIADEVVVALRRVEEADGFALGTGG